MPPTRHGRTASRRLALRAVGNGKLIGNSTRIVLAGCGDRRADRSPIAFTEHVCVE